MTFYFSYSFRTTSRVLLRPLPTGAQGWRRHGQRRNVTAQWRDHLNWERVSQLAWSHQTLNWLMVRPRFELTTSRSADRRSSNSANRAAVTNKLNPAAWLQEETKHYLGAEPVVQSTHHFLRILKQEPNISIQDWQTAVRLSFRKCNFPVETAGRRQHDIFCDRAQ